MLTSIVQVVGKPSQENGHLEYPPDLRSTPLQEEQGTAAGDFTMGKVSAKKRHRKRRHTSKLLKIAVKNAELATDAGVRFSVTETDRHEPP